MLLTSSEDCFNCEIGPLYWVVEFYSKNSKDLKPMVLWVKSAI